MKRVFSVLLVIMVHLNLNLAHADATDDFMQTLKTTPFDAIDLALVRLRLFVDGENRNSNIKGTQLKFIHTNNRIELTSIIRKLRSEMSTAECNEALRNLQSVYTNTELTKIAFPNHSSDERKLASEVFNYQTLLVDKVQPTRVFTCN